MKKSNVLILFMLLQGLCLYGQKHEIGLFGGFSIYQGDLVFSTITTEGSKPSGGIFYKNHYSNKIAIRAALNTGQYSGSDSNFPTDLPERNFSFETQYTDFSIGAEYLFLGGTTSFGKFRKYFSPFVHIGLGGVYANPTVKNEGRIELDAKDLDYQKLHFMVPISAGVRLIVTERLSIDVEFSARTPFSDYLDGISESANPNKNDWYYLIGLNIGYKIGKATLITSED